MPLYEYVCRKCSHQFEELIFGDAKPSCPTCRSNDLEKLMSVVAVGKGKAGQSDLPPNPCGSCSNRGQGGCGMN